MTVLLTVPFLVVLSGIAGGRWWMLSRRRDEKSIEAHRSTLGVIEHVSGTDEIPSRPHDPTTAHVRIVGSPASGRPRPAEDQGVVPTTPLGRRSNRPSFPLPKDTRLCPPEVVASQPARPSRLAGAWQPARPTRPSRAAPAAEAAAAPAAEAAPPTAAPPAESPSSPRPATMSHEVARLIAARARSRRDAGELGSPDPGAAAPGGRGTSGSGTASRPPRAARRRLTLTFPQGYHRLSMVTAALAVAMVLAAITGVALNTGGRARPGPSKVAAGHGAATGTGAAHQAPPTVATTVAPALVATSTNSAYATYTANVTSLDVSFAASGACWVELRSGSAAGPVLYEGTLPAGAAQVFHAVGSVWLRIGDPVRLKLTIDGAPVALPAASNPFDEIGRAHV